LEPLDADEFGAGKDTARVRFAENVNMIDYDALQKQTQERKSKLDHIQHLLFDNQMQEEK